VHHHISDSSHFPLDITTWLGENKDDPAFMVAQNDYNT
jgi:hypothetical protein